MQNGAQIIVNFLESVNVHVVAGMPGGANLPLYDALYSSSIQHVLARHEQGAGFIAQGMARASGFPGVCFATSGPGATNLLTALADAKMDSIPIFAVTGQVPKNLIGTDAFQEVDTCGMAAPLVKRAYFISNTEELYRILPEAWLFMQSGKPGPVLIDVPKDVQQNLAEGSFIWPETDLSPVSALDVQRFCAEITSSSRPILYIGGGVISAGASDLVRTLARQNSIPIVSTLMGLGAIPSTHPLYLGMLGMHGEAYTNFTLEEADLLIALGVRFDDRATGKLSEFCLNARVIHVDTDRRELGKLRRPDIAIESDLKSFLSVAVPVMPADDRSVWHERIRIIRAEHPSENEAASGCYAILVLNEISKILGPEDIITTDVGQHQMWVAQAYNFRNPRTLLTSGGLGTMGFGLPAAIGAALALPDRTVVCISGDGSILLNIQELALLHELDLNIKIIVMDNGHLGLVRQQQDLFYGKRISAARFNSSPDFCGLGRSFHIAAMRLERQGFGALKDAIETPGPMLIHVELDAEDNVYPMVAPGKANREMIRRDSA